MVKEFCFWLNSIIDKTPPTEEINTALLIIKKRNNYAYIELNFYEGEPSLNKPAFCPLEAQFFYHNLLNNVSDKILEYRIKNLIEEAFEDSSLIKIFKGYKIYLYNNEKIEYLFNI